jgi:hypothetical protein
MTDRYRILRALRRLEQAIDTAVAESKLSYERRADSYSFGCASACMAAQTALIALRQVLGDHE